MKNFLTTALLLSLTLTACGTVNSIPVVPVETPAAAETYTWEKHGISFEVPEGLVASDMAYIDALYLDTQDMSTFEGDNPGQVSIHPSADKTLEEIIAQYSNDESFEQGEVQINGKTFTTVAYHSEFADYDVVLYLIENNGTIYSISKGWTGNQDDLDVVLESLEF